MGKWLGKIVNRENVMKSSGMLDDKSEDEWEMENLQELDDK